MTKRDDIKVGRKGHSGPNSKIPDTLVPDLVLMKAQGKELKEIQSWLKDNHNISVGIPALSRRCRYSVKFDRTLTQTIYARASAAGAEGIVKSLISNLDEIHNVSNKMLQENNIPEWRLSKKLELEYLRAHLELFGHSKLEKDDEIGDIDQILSHLGGAKATNGVFDAEFEETIERDSEEAFQLATKDQLPDVIELEHQEVMNEVKIGGIDKISASDLPNGRTEEWMQKFWSTAPDET